MNTDKTNNEDKNLLYPCSSVLLKIKILARRDDFWQSLATGGRSPKPIANSQKLRADG
jgi:hypothetical protein